MLNLQCFVLTYFQREFEIDVECCFLSRRGLGPFIDHFVLTALCSFSNQLDL